MQRHPAEDPDAGHTLSLPWALQLFLCPLILPGAMGAACSKWASTSRVFAFPGLLWLTYGASPPLRTKLWARNAAGSSIQRLFWGGGRINEFPWNDSRHGRVKPPGLGLCPVLITTLLRLPTVTPAGLSAWHFRHTVSLGKCYLYSIQSTKSAQHEEN